jgi:hypothetical protein
MMVLYLIGCICLGSQSQRNLCLEILRQRPAACDTLVNCPVTSDDTTMHSDDGGTHIVYNTNIVFNLMCAYNYKIGAVRSEQSHAM